MVKYDLALDERGVLITVGLSGGDIEARIAEIQGRAPGVTVGQIVEGVVLVNELQPKDKVVWQNSPRGPLVYDNEVFEYAVMRRK